MIGGGSTLPLDSLRRPVPHSSSLPFKVDFKLIRRLFTTPTPRPCSGQRAFSMGRRKNKKKSHWSAYNPTDASPDATEGGTPGGPAFFHYHPGGSGINQSWWFNTFGKQQDPLLEGEEDPATSTSSENKNEVWNEFPLEPKAYDSKYREYRPPPRSPSPPSLPRHPRSRTATPPPPHGPSSEYIATSDDPSHLLTDPASSRKLLVLDLNGTLLHRSPHSSKNVPRYPIPGQQGFQPRLRSVHPRPYLPSFKSYIFHPSNKEWLDVMVWSSAQPHSVSDMVDKCFHGEKHHLVAVWARDTLGLPQHLYSTAIPPITHTIVDTQYTFMFSQFPFKARKVQTLKDLNIPWSKLFIPDPPGAESHPAPRHTAGSTLLMDDSPRKAELQPYNHLCVKEYSNVIRNRDLVSLLEEKAWVKSPSPPLPTEESEPQSSPPPPPQPPLGIPHSLIPPTIHHQQPTQFGLPPPPLDPASDFLFDQSVGIQPGATLLNPLPPFTSNAGGYPRLPGDSGLGQGVIAPQMLFKNPSPSIMGYQNSQPFQQLPQSTNPFAPSQQSHHSISHPHPLMTESPAQPTPTSQEKPLPLIETATEEVKSSSVPLTPSTPTSRKRKRKENRKTEPKPSMAGPIPEIEYDETLLAIIGILDEVRHQSNVASWVKTGGLWGPYPPQHLANPNVCALAHDNFRNSCEDSAALSDSGSADSGRHGEGKKKRGNAVTAVSGASVVDGPKDDGSAYTATQNQTNASETPPWFDNPLTMRHWVDRGRNALETLGIPIEHGLKQ